MKLLYLPAVKHVEIKLRANINNIKTKLTAMKQFLLFLLINLPLLGYGQSWTGDTDKFTLEGDYLMMDADKEAESLTLEQSYAFPANTENWQWEFSLYFKTKPTNSNYIDVYPVEGEEIRFHAGKNGHDALFSFSVGSQEVTFTFDKYEYKETTVSVCLSLKDGEYWTVTLEVYDEQTAKQEQQTKQIEAAMQLPAATGFQVKMTHTKTYPKHFGVSNQITLSEEIAVLPEEPDHPSTSFSAGDIRINEVMANPNGFVPPTEYIELYNTLDREVQLTGWTLQYANNNPIALDEVKMKANGYVVLYRTGDEAFDLPAESVCALDQFPANLANDGKALALYYNEEEIDQYTYPEAEAGKSWEYGDDGWHLCSDERGGTPGEENSDGITEEEPELPAESFAYQSVRLTEVMANPKGFEPETEYIELFNTLDQSVTLAGWTLQYDGKRDMALDGISMPAGSYAVLYDKEKTPLTEANAYPVEKLYPLANEGEKSLVLYDATGKEIDACTYPKAKAGKSWEYGAAGWHVCSDERGGTPGEENSDDEADSDEESDESVGSENPDLLHPEAGEIVINELLPEPFAGGSEYIELLNRSERDLSLADVSLSTRKKEGTLGTPYSLASYEGVLEAGGYLLLSKSIAGVEAFYTLPVAANCLECKLPVLSNTGASVVLYRTSDETIIDEVTYSPKWHDALVKNHKGVALERIHPEGDSQDASNWTSAASAAGGGTPGAQNSQVSAASPTGNESISIPIYQSGNYQISYQLTESGYSARGWVFDMNGRRVAVLADNVSLGTQGTLEWDGCGSNGTRLSSGVYIMYLELWTASGKIHRKKAAFLVH